MKYIVLILLLALEVALGVYTSAGARAWFGGGFIVGLIFLLLVDDTWSEGDGSLFRKLCALIGIPKHGTKTGAITCEVTTHPSAVVATQVVVVEDKSLPRDTLSEPSKTILEMIETDMKWAAANGKDGRWMVSGRTTTSYYDTDTLSVQDTQGSFKCSWNICRGMVLCETWSDKFIYNVREVNIMGKEIYSLYNKLLEESIRKKKEAQKAKLIEEYCGGKSDVSKA